ncbi:MAG: hypothetical protein RhofKO_23990 [Rhodothermales bacterium]
MRIGFVALCICLSFTPLGCAQAPKAVGFVVHATDAILVVQPPKPRPAFDYLERTLADMDFFRANNYLVSLPDHAAFDGSAPSTSDFNARLTLFTQEVYDPTAFEAALTTLATQQPQLQTALERMNSWSDYDGFARLDSATVTLTLYGPGGSFNPDTGDIILWTDTQGHFKGGGGLHTIVHEMIHLAIEQGIANPLDLQHWERERLVDLLAQREFADLLPDYRLQNGPNAPMDRFVIEAPLEDMRESVATYVQERTD